MPVPAKVGGAMPKRHPSLVSEGLAYFAEHVPIPMKEPGDSMEGKKPWTMFDNNGPVN